MVIPRIIHQVWKNNNIPFKWKLGPFEWKRLHPFHKYILWTDVKCLKYLKTYHHEYLEIYQNYEYDIQRADFIRYFILYDFGGIYSDLDQYPLENIEKYINSSDVDYFTTSTIKNFNYITNNLMISRRKSPIFLTIINNLNNKIPFYSIGRYLTVFYSTGPLFITNVVRGQNNNYVILPSSKFNQYSIFDDYNNLKPNIVIRGMKGSSWDKEETFLLMNWFRIVILIFFLFLIINFKKVVSRIKMK